jgi:hypothetical protein
MSGTVDGVRLRGRGEEVEAACVRRDKRWYDRTERWELRSPS